MLSKEQKQIMDVILDRLVESGVGRWPGGDLTSFSIRIGGYAGTGKTHLLSQIRKEIFNLFPRLGVAFVAFTGKAASVLENKLINAGCRFSDDYVGTIHGMIYRPETEWDPITKTQIIKRWVRRDPDEIWHQLIFMDEASMVSRKIWRDLLSYHRPIVAVGDHGQLPPVGDTFNLITNPDYTLTEIHRQALNSPIIKLSKFIRENGYVPFNTFFSKEVFKLSWELDQCKKIWNNIKFSDDIMVLAPFNQTRKNLNDQIRDKLKYKHKTPYPGERVVCLKNNHGNGIMNGQIGTVLWVMPEDYGLHRMTIQMDGFEFPHECMVSDIAFGEKEYNLYNNDKAAKEQREYASEKGFPSIDYFDYGYATSVHKSQGSEWNRVVVFEQRTKHWDDEMYARLLYTAITRAKEKLFVISDYWG